MAVQRRQAVEERACTSSAGCVAARNLPALRRQSWINPTRIFCRHMFEDSSWMDKRWNWFVTGQVTATQLWQTERSLLAKWSSKKRHPPSVCCVTKRAPQPWAYVGRNLSRNRCFASAYGQQHWRKHADQPCFFSPIGQPRILRRQCLLELLNAFVPTVVLREPARRACRSALADRHDMHVMLSGSRLVLVLHVIYHFLDSMPACAVMLAI